MQTWFHYVRIATAHTELHEGRETVFGPGVVEVDGTKTMISRSGRKIEQALWPLPDHVPPRHEAMYPEPLVDKDVKKGAPPPPECYDDVRGPTLKKLRPGHILSSGSAQAYKNIAPRRSLTSRSSTSSSSSPPSHT